MELFIILLLIGLAAVFLTKLANPTDSDGVVAPSSVVAENRVTSALRALGDQSYVVFENIILPSNGNTSHTEIDHVVVSPFGIFCIETKSHRGSIYGYTKSKNWKQYLGGKKFDFYNPQRQNYKHVLALADLLGENLKTPIHSYVVMPYASKVKIDGEVVDLSIDEVIRRVKNHQTGYYNLQECTTILRTIAVASSESDSKRSGHIQEVRQFIG